jgi:hypothetical protein
LEIVDPDLGWGMQIPTRLGREGRHMTGGAWRLAREEQFPPSGSLLVETPRRRLRCRDRQLIQVQPCESRRDEVGIVAHMTESVSGGDRELACII